MTSDTRPIVYVVDDDAAMRDSLCLLLKTEDLPSQGYATAEQFLQDCKAGEQCCLILDARLPGMSGAELLDAMAERGIEIPVIMITGYANADTDHALERQCVLKCLEKPFRAEELLGGVREALAHRT